jgi:hypothetical protein
MEITLQKPCTLGQEIPGIDFAVAFVQHLEVDVRSGGGAGAAYRFFVS